MTLPFTPRAKALAAAAVALAGLIAGCTATPRTTAEQTPPAEPAATPAAAQEESLDQEAAIDYAKTYVAASRLIKAGKFTEAYAAISDLISSEMFEKLPTAERHRFLQDAAILGAQKNDFRRAHPLFVAASKLPESDRNDWWGRYDLALRLQDAQDATIALTTVVRRWPELLPDLNYRPIWRLATGWAEPKADEETRLGLLEALYGAKFRGELGVEPSGMWLEFTRILVDRGRVDQAAEVARHVTDARDVLALRIDRRFDALISGKSQQFELAGVAARSLEEWRAVVDQNPAKLQAAVRLADHAIDYGRYDEALAVTDRAIAKAKAPKPGETPYDDVATELNWIHDSRARALRGLGRWDEAEQEQKRSASMRENGEANVSNTINLAIYQMQRGRLDEASRLLSPDFRNGKAVSGYGAMAVQYTLYAVALQKKDSRAAQASMDYMREHQDDAIETYQDALVVSQNHDEAAALLARRLDDQALRTSALLQTQAYREAPPLAPFYKREREAWRKFRVRDDVRAAIDKVGRLEEVPLPPP